MLLAAALSLPAGAGAQVTADEIASRARQIYFEGFPLDAARDLTPAAVDRLAQMLASPDERDYWSNVVLALGASGSPRAVAPLATFAQIRPTGEVDAAWYQARMALPVALGSLASDSDEAFALLRAMARDSSPDPGWSFQSLRGASLAGALRRAAVTGLAVSGRPDAEVVFDELRDEPGTAHSELASHLESARALRARVERDGASALRRRETFGGAGP